MAVSPGVEAATATFSLDGTHVFLIDPGNEASGLIEVDLGSGTIRKLAIPTKQPIEAVSLSRSGYVLWATAGAVHAYDPQKRTVAKACDAPEGTDISDIAYNPSTAATLICTRPKMGAKTGASDSWDLYLLSRNSTKPALVFNRRVRYVDGPVFDQDGTLFFATEGDGWCGAVSEPHGDPNERPTLYAYRYAPLATRETSLGTPSQTGIRDLAIAREYVYAHLRRMGGSGWGDLLRIHRPQLRKPGPGQSDEPVDPLLPKFRMPGSFDEYSDLYRASLQSVEMLGENGSRSFLCASPDGRRVFYRTFGGEENARAKYWLVDGEAQPRTLELNLP